MPPKKTLCVADVRFVGEGRRVDRQQDDVVPLALQFGGQRVVADDNFRNTFCAAPAVKARIFIPHI